MLTMFKGREVEIVDFEVGRHYDEACILEANYTDGEMESLTEEEMEILEADITEDLLQIARENAADAMHDRYKDDYYEAE